MRHRICAISLLGMVAACSASAQTPAPERPAKSTAGKVKPASAGSGTARATSPQDAGAAHERESDERRATESKQKMKKRPGYKDQAPSPRA